MNRLLHIGKVALLLAGVLVMVSSVYATSHQLETPVTEQESSGEPTGEETYLLQAFDAVSQNVQLQISNPFLPIDVVITIEDDNENGSVNFSEKLVKEYFKILFEQIISANAP